MVLQFLKEVGMRPKSYLILKLIWGRSEAFSPYRSLYFIGKFKIEVQPDFDLKSKQIKSVKYCFTEENQ